MTKQTFFSTVVFMLLAYHIKAQIDKDSPLFNLLRKQDSTFFERGFNRCDIAYLEKTIADDLRFYHDQSGVQNREAFFENIQKYICSDLDRKPIRKVDSESLEVFPRYDNGELYGAIQHGIHHFYIQEAEKEDLWTSTARFTSVWVLHDGAWKLSEVLSYDHQAPQTHGLDHTKVLQLLKHHHVPAMGLGIIENRKLVKAEVYGTLDHKTTASNNTIFKVASLTKPIVAIITLKLIDEGWLGLDEPLHLHWIDPGIKNDIRHQKLTARLVLSHQTGFPNWRYMTESNQLAFKFDPGTSVQYSGAGLNTLERQSKSKWVKV